MLDLNLGYQVIIMFTLQQFLQQPKSFFLLDLENAYDKVHYQDHSFTFYTVHSFTSFNIHYRNVLITQVNNKLLPAKVDDINELQNLVNECHSSFGDELGIACNANDLTALILCILNSLIGLLPEKSEASSFFKEQGSLLNVHRRCATYSAEFSIFYSLFKSISLHTYFIRLSSFIILPSESTVKSLNSNILTSPMFEQGSSRLLRYIRGKFPLLGADGKTVILLMDEIHVKSAMDYKGKSIVGASDNGEKFTSACVFMVCSLQSSYKDVAHIIPVHKMTGKNLHSYILEMVIGLEDIGFEVFGVISDSNPVNRKAILLFADPPDLKYLCVHPKTSQMQCSQIIGITSNAQFITRT